MKKWGLVLLSLIAVFFIKIDFVQAFIGPYAYDVNSMTVSGTGDSLIITLDGWAVISRGDGRTPSGTTGEGHNIQPTYKLHFVASLPEGEVELVTFNDDSESTKTAAKYSYDAASDTPYDLTAAYYDHGSYSAQGKTKKRASNGTVCNNGNTSISDCNYLYINTFFTFNARMADVKQALTNVLAGRTDITEVKVFMVLEVVTAGGKVTVYGQQIDTKSSFTQKIKLGIQANRVNEDTGTLLSDNYITLGDVVTNVTLIATNAKARCQTGGYWCDLSSGLHCRDSCSNKIKLNKGNTGDLYPNGRYYVNSVVQGRYISGVPNTVWNYYVKMKSNGKPGDDYKTIIPSFWTRPYNPLGGTYIIIKLDGTRPNPWGDQDLAEDTIDRRPLTCDTNLETTFDYTTPSKKVFDNKLCDISCTETLNARFQPAPKNIKSGTGFAYPIVFNGTRVCSLSYYNMDTWITDMNEAVTEAFKSFNGTYAPSYYYEWINKITELNNHLTECQNAATAWENENKYDMDAKITGSVDTGAGPDTVAFTKTSGSLPTPTIDKASASYTVKECIGDCHTVNEAKTINVDTWTQTSKLENVTYEFDKDYWVEKYTGQKTDTPQEGKQYWYVGRKYLTEIDQAADEYSFDLTVNEVGRNIGSYWKRKWGIDLDCYYTVINPDFPPAGETELGFIFRPISLTDPFPGGRQPGANWRNNVSKITPLTELQYLATLTPANMRDIRANNKMTPNIYGIFDMDAAERSNFIHFGDYANLFSIK